MATTDSAQRVSTFEIFFDLVFVFTLTQLTALLAHDLSAEGALRAALIFAVLFWMYGAYVWATNQVPPTHPLRQALLIAGMAAFLVCALAIPEAFHGTGVIFGVGYLLVVLAHAALYVQVYGRAVLAFAPLNILSALIVIGAGFVDRPLRTRSGRSSSRSTSCRPCSYVALSASSSMRVISSSATACC